MPHISPKFCNGSFLLKWQHQCYFRFQCFGLLSVVAGIEHKKTKKKQKEKTEPDTSP